MSQSPNYKVAGSVATGAYADAWGTLDRLLAAGKSFSGRERHCCFLNTGGPRFATISAASGFDLPGDGRALAITDWDFDGDQDVWLTNRTAPRVQLFRNDTPPGAHFLKIRLEGRSCNRDAIGARVEVTARVEGRGTSDEGRGARGEGRQVTEAGTDSGGLGGVPPRITAKTLRAGEGYLSQSSKWLHFGLGDASRIDSVVVRWPDGTSDEYSDLAVDRHYHLVQGDPAPRPWRPPPTPQLAATTPRVPSPTDQIQLFLSERIPMLPLQYEAFSGELTDALNMHGRPTLINLWATWCSPCIQELSEFTQHADDLRRAGLDVVALSVDEIEGTTSQTVSDPRKMMEKLEFPFRAGMASARLVDNVQLLLDAVLKGGKPLPVPTSLLVDQDGQLRAIYKGPVGINRLLNDVNRLSLEGDPLLAASQPFAGRWISRPMPMRLATLASELVEYGYVDDAIRFAYENRTRLSRELDYPRVVAAIGLRLEEQGQVQEAEAWFREAVQGHEDSMVGPFNLGIFYEKQGRFEEALAAFRGAAAAEPDSTIARVAVAMTLTRLGRLEEAVNELRAALELDPRNGEIRMRMANTLRRLGRIDEALEHWYVASQCDPPIALAHYQIGLHHVTHRRLSQAEASFRAALAIDPQLFRARSSLAQALHQQGRTAEAIDEYRAALAGQPTLVIARQNLAWLLATHPDPAIRNGDEAVRLAEGVAEELEHKDAATLDTLAAAYAEAGRFQDAVTTQTRAADLSEADGQQDQASEFRERLRQYERGEPFRDSVTPPRKDEKDG